MMHLKTQTNIQSFGCHICTRKAERLIEKGIKKLEKTPDKLGRDWAMFAPTYELPYIEECWTSGITAAKTIILVLGTSKQDIIKAVTNSVDELSKKTGLPHKTAARVHEFFNLPVKEFNKTIKTLVDNIKTEFWKPIS